MFFVKYADREKLIKKLEYQRKNGDKRNDYSDINDFILAEIKIIKNYLRRKKAIHNDNFVLCVRAEHCMNEFYTCLKKKEYEMCFYDLFEFIESDKNKLYETLTQRQSEYNYCKYITSKEIIIISKMIEELENKLKKSN